MSENRNRKAGRRKDERRTARRWIGVATLLVVAAAGATATGQQVYVAQEAPAPPVAYTVAGVGGGAAGWGESPQLPQDIRIMQRIVSTALAEVEAPPFPETPEGAAEADAPAPTRGAAVWAPPAPGSGVSVLRARPVMFGGRDISGFYMPGYGYLFNVEWRLSGRLASDEMTVALRAAEVGALALEADRRAEAAAENEARAAEEARAALVRERDRLEQRREVWTEWSAQYRQLLAEELRGVVAQYGSTLSRAQPDESITFIADFGGGPEATATVTVRRGELAGVGREQNLSAVQLAWGGAAVSGALDTELKIMSAIIDGALEEESSGRFAVAYSGGVWSSESGSGYQYVPRYGALFRRSARLNLATRLIQEVAPGRAQAGVSPDTLRQRMEESTAEQQRTLAEHLVELRRTSAEILATYGPTLSQMDGDQWVGLYFDVGSAAGLLEGGMSDYLVQARMSDIRQAATQGDPAGWLEARLVTNEKQE